MMTLAHRHYHQPMIVALTVIRVSTAVQGMVGSSVMK